MIEIKHTTTVKAELSGAQLEALTFVLYSLPYGWFEDLLDQHGVTITDSQKEALDSLADDIYEAAAEIECNE